MIMTNAVNKLVLSMVLTLLLALFLAGCKSGPVDTPVGQRAPGQDLSAQDRADKRGDVPVAPASK